MFNWHETRFNRPLRSAPVCCGREGACFCAEPVTAAATGHEADGHRAALAPIKLKINALRHSFISYRVAETNDVPKVALEAGNSPAMIFQHYRELVTPEDLLLWFAIVPGKAAPRVPVTPPAPVAERRRVFQMN